MPEIIDEIVAKVTAAADRILDFLIGPELKVREAKARIPDVYRVLEARRRMMRRLPPSGFRCDR